MTRLQACIAALLISLPATAETPSSVEWAKDWEQAAKRAKKEKKLVVVLVELYRGMNVPAQLHLMFEDLNLSALMRERFVGLRWKDDMEAPFERAEVWGMAGVTFGAGLLVADAEGRVVGQSPPVSTWSLDRDLRAILARNPEAAGRPPEGMTGLVLALSHYYRGELDLAGALLEKPANADAWRLRAAVEQRQLLGKEALESIRSALKLRPGDVELRMDEGGILTGMGRFDEAAALFSELARMEPPHARSAEARFFECRLIARTDAEAAEKGFADLARLDPQSRWGQWAKALVEGGYVGTLKLAALAWPDREALDVTREVPSSPGEDEAAAAKGAVAFLVASQRRDGSWMTPYALAREVPAFSMSVASICGEGLLRHRDHDGAESAATRALGFVLESVTENALERQGEFHGFGYSVWARIFSLRFLARCAQAGLGERVAIEGAMEILVRDLSGTQLKNGGWSYFVGAEITFVTAAAVLALQEAKDAGAAVPDKVLARACAALKRSRGADGAFGYMIGQAGGGGEACLRSAQGAHALHRAAAPDAGAIRTALDLFLRHRDEIRKERGKVLCHTAPDGTAAYFLLFGYQYAAEALHELPAADREVYREALLADILAARLEDGSFLDFPTVGRYYGTGMALLALSRLRSR